MTKRPDVNQQCIGLFDEFTHGTMNRRDAMERTAELAGGEAADLAGGRTVEFLKGHISE